MTGLGKWVMGGLSVALLVILYLVFLLTRGHHAMTDARQQAEFYRLQLASQIVAHEDTKKQLGQALGDLFEKDALFKQVSADAQRAAPNSHVTGVASLSTGVLPVEPEGPPPVPVCTGTDILHDDLAGILPASWVCGPALIQGAPVPTPAACALHDGDNVSLEVSEVVLTTDRSNLVLAGVARAWREKPLPRAKLAEGKFQSAQSDTSALAVPSPPRWGVEVAGLCMRQGCGPGLGVLFPPWTLPVLGWRTEARADAFLGPQWAVTVGMGLRF